MSDTSDKISAFYKKKYMEDKIKQHNENKDKIKSVNNNTHHHYVDKYVKKTAGIKFVKKHISDKQISTINKIFGNLKKRIYDTIIEKKLSIYDKNSNIKIDYYSIIGCNEQKLKEHLENLFTEGMSIDNYGEWQVDHIYPISRYELSDIDNFYECFNYKNLQPLWKEENIKKSNKLPSEYNIMNHNIEAIKLN